MEKATTDVWSFPDRVLVIAVAPVLSGNQVAALMMVGFEVGTAALGSVEQMMGVSGALVVADRIVARGSSDAALTAAFEAGRAVAEGESRLVEAGGRYLVRVTRTSDAAAAARAVWLVPHRHQAGPFRAVPLCIWMPVLAVLGMLAL